MIERYLGKKTQILAPLLTTVGRHARPGDHVVDIFSGSLSVGIAFKGAGYRVTANDINLFSSVLAEAFLIPTAPGEVQLAELVDEPDVLRARAAEVVASLVEREGYASLADDEWRTRYTEIVALLLHLGEVEPADLPAASHRSHFFDTYSEEGLNSAFESSRGRKGRRRFFSAPNAKRLDAALNQLRVWHQRALLPRDIESTLLASIMRGAERVANTQGTYHDFPRDVWDSRAFQAIRFDPPPLDLLSSSVTGHRAGREQDSLTFIQDVDEHAVLYIDPPYNFRQYTAYYFLLNVICRYPHLDDPDDYFASVRYVRGQNPHDDFTSTFCKPKAFLSELQLLIERADTRAVVLSYFTGKNHWSSFDSARDDTGLELLSEFLSSDLFEDGTLRVEEVERRNYASYGGFKARRVSELLLSAKKLQGDARGIADRATGSRLHSVA